MIHGWVLAPPTHVEGAVYLPSFCEQGKDVWPAFLEGVGCRKELEGAFRNWGYMVTSATLFIGDKT